LRPRLTPTFSLAGNWWLLSQNPAACMSGQSRSLLRVPTDGYLSALVDFVVTCWPVVTLLPIAELNRSGGYGPRFLAVLGPGEQARSSVSDQARSVEARHVPSLFLEQSSLFACCYEDSLLPIGMHSMNAPFEPVVELALFPQDLAGSSGGHSFPAGHGGFFWWSLSSRRTWRVLLVVKFMLWQLACWQFHKYR